MPFKLEAAARIEANAIPADFIKQIKEAFSLNKFDRGYGPKVPGASPVDLKERFRGTPYAKVKFDMKLMFALRNAGFYVAVSKGKRDGRGKDMEFWFHDKNKTV